MPRFSSLSSFLELTAQDYDIPLDQVKEIYHKHNSSNSAFYLELEQVLRDRQDS